MTVKKTKIEWADSTWNPITGCTPTSAGCDNCYAKNIATRFAGTAGYPKENPFGVTFHPERLKTPLAWTKPRRIFVCSMSDLFHDEVKQEWIDEIFNVMSNAPRHTFLVLTKRPERMKAALKDLGNRWNWNVKWPLENVWLGVTAENQETARDRIPTLIETPATKRFVSVEPMLGAINLKQLGRHPAGWPFCPSIDWVICGGETGPKARPMNYAWVYEIAEQCWSIDTPFFFKSWGEWTPSFLQPDGGYKANTDANIPDGSSADCHVFPENPGICMRKIGKRRSGRMIRNSIWNEVPE